MEKHKRWSPGTLMAQAYRDIANEHNATVDALEAALDIRALDDMDGKPIRVPFADAQIEKMARACCDRWNHEGMYDLDGPTIKRMWQDCIRAALAAGGIEPCAAPEYDPKDVALEVEPRTDLDLSELFYKMTNYSDNDAAKPWADSKYVAAMTAIRKLVERQAPCAVPVSTERASDEELLDILTDAERDSEAIAAVRSRVEAPLLAEIAELRAERDDYYANWQRESEAVALRQSVPVKVKLPDIEDVNGHLIKHNFSTTTHIEMAEALRYAAAHAVIDVPTGVPSVEELVKVYFSKGIVAVTEESEGGLEATIAAIRDRVLAGVATERQALTEVGKPIEWQGAPDPDTLARVAYREIQQSRLFRSEGYDQWTFEDLIPEYKSALRCLGIAVWNEGRTTPTTPTDEQVEVLARVLHEALDEDGLLWKWSDASAAEKTRARNSARAAFAHGLPLRANVTEAEIAEAMWCSDGSEMPEDGFSDGSAYPHEAAAVMALLRERQVVAGGDDTEKLQQAQDQLIYERERNFELVTERNRAEGALARLRTELQQAREQLAASTWSGPTRAKAEAKWLEVNGNDLVSMSCAKFRDWLLPQLPTERAEMPTREELIPLVGNQLGIAYDEKFSPYSSRGWEYTQSIIDALAPWLREPTGWELDVPEGGWLSNGFCIHNPATGESHSLESFVSHVCSRIRPAFGPCKECAKKDAELRRHNDKWTGFIQRCQADARAALEGE